MAQGSPPRMIRLVNRLWVFQDEVSSSLEDFDVLEHSKVILLVYDTPVILIIYTLEWCIQSE
jgi:hypothetical protein